MGAGQRRTRLIVVGLVVLVLAAGGAVAWFQPQKLFIDLRTSNGPDLFVYLSTTPADGPRDAFDDEFLSPGRLKANQGNQNYAIGAGTRLDRYRSVVIWCRRFTYAFGAAELDPAR